MEKKLFESLFPLDTGIPDAISPRILIRSFWNLDHLLNMVIKPCVAKIRIFRTYTTFFLLTFIFHKKLQVEVGYRFLFCLVYIKVYHFYFQKAKLCMYFILLLLMLINVYQIK